MEDLGKQVGYLKGLMEGMDIEKDSANGKLLAGIVELLGELSDRVEAIDELLDDLNDYVESIDDDLSELEGDRDSGEDLDAFDESDGEDEDFDDAFGEGEDQLHLLRPAHSDGEGDDEDALEGNLCPKCSRMFFTVPGKGEDTEYICPHCKARVKPLPLTPENAPIAQPADE